MSITVQAALIEAALGRGADVAASFRVYAVSPGTALKYAADVAAALNVEAVHDLEGGWFEVGDDVTIYYPEVAE